MLRSGVVIVGGESGVESESVAILVKVGEWGCVDASRLEREGVGDEVGTSSRRRGAWEERESRLSERGVEVALGGKGGKDRVVASPIALSLHCDVPRSRAVSKACRTKRGTSGRERRSFHFLPPPTPREIRA